jgi:hypothetical protein
VKRYKKYAYDYQVDVSNQVSLNIIDCYFDEPNKR